MQTNDIYELERLIKNGKSFNGFSKVYKNTNERLKEIFSNFDFQDKEILSVMASADQLFSAYYLGAKNVDTFDKNLATYYYFYLKKWYFMMYGEYVIKNDQEKLLRCLNMAIESNEEEMNAAYVWKEILTRYSNISRMFYHCYFNWSVPYSDDPEKMKDIIKDKQANFQELNLFNDINIDKKYDIIILSNVLEYLRPKDKENYVVANNLNKLLKPNGIVINTILLDMRKVLQEERKMYSENFVYELSKIKAYNRSSKTEVPLYYTYTKKP